MNQQSSLVLRYRFDAGSKTHKPIRTNQVLFFFFISFHRIYECSHYFADLQNNIDLLELGVDNRFKMFEKPRTQLKL